MRRIGWASSVILLKMLVQTLGEIDARVTWPGDPPLPRASSSGIPLNVRTSPIFFFQDVV